MEDFLKTCCFPVLHHLEHLIDLLSFHVFLCPCSSVIRFDLTWLIISVSSCITMVIRSISSESASISFTLIISTEFFIEFQYFLHIKIMNEMFHLRNFFWFFLYYLDVHFLWIGVQDFFCWRHILGWKRIIFYMFELRGIFSYNLWVLVTVLMLERSWRTMVFAFSTLPLQLNNSSSIFREYLWFIQFFGKTLKNITISFLYFIEAPRHFFRNSSHISITNMTTYFIHAEEWSSAKISFLQLPTDKLFESWITESHSNVNHISFFEEVMELFFEILRGFFDLLMFMQFFWLNCCCRACSVSGRSFHTTTCLCERVIIFQILSSKMLRCT